MIDPYVENLKLMSTDELKASAANNSICDMYRYAMCVLEIKRREILCTSYGFMDTKQCLECKVPVHEGPNGSYLNEDGTYHVCDKQ